MGFLGKREISARRYSLLKTLPPLVMLLASESDVYTKRKSKFGLVTDMTFVITVLAMY